MEAKIDKRKGKGKYWYFVTVYTCVLCGHEDKYRERRYDPKPADWWERHKFHEEACGSHF
jgi:hypothetical protein